MSDTATVDPPTDTTPAETVGDAPAETPVESPPPVDAAPAEPVAETPIVRPDPVDEVAILREHDRKVRELAEEHVELEREWEAAKAQTKSAKDALDECALRLRNACLDRPALSAGPLFDQPADEPASEPVADWRETPLRGNVVDSLAEAAASVEVQTYGDVHDWLCGDTSDEVIGLLMDKGAVEIDARSLVARVLELEAAETPAPVADAAPADPDYWKPVDISELSLAAKLTEKLREQGINTLGELSDAVAKHQHEGYRGLEGVGAAKAEQIEDAWQNWFAKHPAAPEDVRPTALKPIADNVPESIRNACGNIGIQNFSQLHKYAERVGHDEAVENLRKWGASADDVAAALAEAAALCSPATAA